MKKFMLGLLGVVVAAVAGFAIFYAVQNSSEGYYVKITTDGEKITGKYDNTGGEYIDYQYDLKGYNKDGKEQEVVFKANKEQPLRKEAYLEVQYVSKKDNVKSWNEVAEKDVPKAALDKLK